MTSFFHRILHKAALPGLLSLGLTGFGSSVHAAVTLLPPTPGDTTWTVDGIPTEPARPDKRYFVEVKVDGQVVPIHQTRFPKHNYVHFVTDQPVKLSLRFNGDHADSVLVPWSATMKIKPVRIDGKNFEYNLQPGDYFYLERLKLTVIANKPLKYNPKETDPEVVSAASLGIDKTGKTNVGPKLNEAILNISKSGGSKKTLFIPPGIYQSSTIMMKSNVTLFLAPGALIRAHTGADGWIDKRDSLGSPAKEAGSGLVFAFTEGQDTIKNAVVAGFGTLDGSGKYWRSNESQNGGPLCNEPYCWEYDKTFRSHVVFFVGTKDSEIREVTVRNPVFNNVRMYGCQRTHFRDLKVFGDWKVNNDGLIVDHVQDCVLENCLVHSGDDGFCYKSSFAWGYKEPSKRVTLRRLTFTTGYPGFKIGWGYHQVMDCHAEDCFFKGGFKIEPKKVFWKTVNGKPTGISDSVIVRNMTFKNVTIWSYFTIKNINEGDIKTWINENLSFENLNMMGPMDATDTRGLHFTNLYQGKTLATDAASARFTAGARTSNITFNSKPVGLVVSRQRPGLTILPLGAAKSFDAAGRSILLPAAKKGRVSALKTPSPAFIQKR